MKKILSLAIAIICMTCATLAQNTFVATLQHGDAVSNYYGMDALIQAYNASETGDIILLSAGVFNSVWVEKGITIRGVGLGQDNKTCIKNDLLVFSKDASWKTRFEGIYALDQVMVYANDSTINAGRIDFVKSRIGLLKSAFGGYSPSSSSTPKVNVIQCITDGFSTGYWASFTCYNSLIMGGYPKTQSSGAQNTTFINCVFSCSGVDEMESAVIVNSIFYTTQAAYQILPSTVLAYNCISITYGRDTFCNLSYGQQQNCFNVSDITTIFKTFNGTFDDYSETFELTEEGQQYLGTDGTQIGMQGGSAKYNTKMSYPVITYMLADDKTTKDGKLNVKIEVSTGE